MRKDNRWVIAFVCAGVLLPTLGAQQKHTGTAAPAASTAVISDAEADQLMQDITAEE